MTSAAILESGWRRLRRFWRPSVRDDVADEVAFHVEMRVAQFMGEGMTRDDAERCARAQFGDVRAVSEQLVSIGARRRRRVDLREWADAVFMDLRYAARSLRKYATSSLIAVLTLALGIGASTAIFSVVNAVLLRPLPYGDASRLGLITEDLHARGVVDGPNAPGDLPDIRAGATLLDGIAGVTTTAHVPFGLEEATREPVTYATATPNIFDVLRLPVVLGRNFTADDGIPAPLRPVGGAATDSTAPKPVRLPRIAIIGYDYWRQRFGGDPSIIGKSLIGPWGPTEVVGIASPNAELLFPPSMHVRRVPDVWEVRRVNLATATRTASEYRLIGRMKPGVSVDMARAQTDSISDAFGERFPLWKSAGAHLRFEPMKAYLVRSVRPALLALMGAVVFVLLVAWANVANLLLVRAVHREREFAVRVAIGGSRWRIVRQLLAESLLLATVAAAAGIALAQLAIVVLERLAPADLPRLTDVSIDGTVLAFTLVATIASGIIFGFVPAIRIVTSRSASVLRASGRTPSLGGAARLRSIVVIAEVSLSFVLLVGCGLMVRSFVALTRVDLGFDPNGLLTFTLSNRNFALAQDRINFVHRVHDKLAALPGVTAVTVSLALPLDGANPNIRWGTRAALDDPAAFRQAGSRPVLPGYFEAMKIPLVAGRTFTREDDAVDHKVIVIDDALAKRAFGDESAIGKPLFVRIRAVALDTFTVIGVVRHQRQTALVGDEMPVMYLSWVTLADEAGRWAVRTSGDPAALGPSVRTALKSVKSNLIVNELQPMSVFVDRAMAPTRFALVLIGVFAVITAILAAVGLYGVLSSIVRQRTSEIGVRMAFGADASHIFSLVIGQGLKLSVVGLVIGIGLALAATRVMASMLVGVRPGDPVTFVAMTAVFLAVAFLACWLPARRAAGLDPNVVLRED